MTVAPQKTEELPDQTIPACHGHSLTSTSWPPTILVDLWAIPQVQSPVPLPPVGGRGVAPDPDPVPPDPEPGYPDPEPVGYPSLGMWTQTHPEWYSPPGIPDPPGIPLPEPPGIPDPPGIPVVLPVEPPTAVTFPTLTLPFLTLNPKVYAYSYPFSVISATFPLHFLSQAPVPFALPLPATVKVKSQVQVFLPTFTLSPVKVSARIAGTRRRMPNEITEALMVKEPMVDLAIFGAWGYLWRCDG